MIKELNEGLKKLYRELSLMLEGNAVPSWIEQAFRQCPRLE